jgi:hypothetical protein
MIINWLQVIITTVITAAAAYGLHALDVTYLNARNAAALQTQAATLTAQCDQAKQLTEGVSREYENQLANLNHQLDGLRQSTTCVPITPTPGGHTSGAQQPKPISEGAIYDLAGEGEKYRIQLIACQQFVTETWKANAH